MEARGQYPGSIPAHTGKPVALDKILYFLKVYPRTHGETIRAPSETLYLSSVGLSPHTRGNRERNGRGRG